MEHASWVASVLPSFEMKLLFAEVDLYEASGYLADFEVDYCLRSVPLHFAVEFDFS